MTIPSDTVEATFEPLTLSRAASCGSSSSNPVRATTTATKTTTTHDPKASSIASAETIVVAAVSSSSDHDDDATRDVCEPEHNSGPRTIENAEFKMEQVITDGATTGSSNNASAKVASVAIVDENKSSIEILSPAKRLLRKLQRAKKRAAVVTKPDPVVKEEAPPSPIPIESHNDDDWMSSGSSSLASLEDTCTTNDNDEHSTAISSLSENSTDKMFEDRLIRSFEYFVVEFVQEMSQHSSKRGKRTNAVNFFSTSNSNLFKERIHENYQYVLHQALVKREDRLRDETACGGELGDGQQRRHQQLLVECHVQASNCLIRQFLNMLHHGTFQTMGLYLPSNFTDEGYISPLNFAYHHVEDYVLTHLAAALFQPMFRDHQGNLDPTPGRQSALSTLVPRTLLQVIVWMELTCVEVQKHLRLDPTKAASTTSTSATAAATTVVISDSWRVHVTQLWQHYRTETVQATLRDQIHRSMKLRCCAGDDDSSDNSNSEDTHSTASCTSSSSSYLDPHAMTAAAVAAPTSSDDTVHTSRSTDKNNDKDICENEHGELVSGHPEMIISVVDGQLQRIMAKAATVNGFALSANYGRDVWDVCLEEVSTMVADFMWYVGTSWKVMTTMRLCSIINDARRLSKMLTARARWMDQQLHSTQKQNKVRRLTSSLLVDDPIENDDPSCSAGSMGSKTSHGSNSKGDPSRCSTTATTTTSILNAATTLRVLSDLTELSWHAIHFLCQRLIYTLLVADPESGMLASVGHPSWETDTKGRPVTRTMTVFRDFLVYVEGWLNPEIFPDVLKKILDVTLQIYVDSFFCNTMRHGVQDVAMVAEHLSQDYLNLVIFFNGSIFQKYAEKRGPYGGCGSSVLPASTIKTRLLILQSLARLMNPSIRPSDLQEDVIRLLEQTTQVGDRNNEAAILHIAGLRQTKPSKKEQKLKSGGKSRTEKPIDWLQMIPLAMQTLQDRHRSPVDAECVPVLVPSPQTPRDIIQLPDIRNSRYIKKMRVGSKELQRRLNDTYLPAAEAMMQMIQPPLTQRNLMNFTGR